MKKGKRIAKLIKETKQEFGLDYIQDYTLNEALFNDGFIASMLCPYIGKKTKEELMEYCKEHQIHNDVELFEYLSREFNIWNTTK